MALSLSRSDQARRRQLAVSKGQATALLAAVTVVWAAITVWGGRSGWTGYVQATLEASMVGGLADWFAVTALFRRPLGLPIPHTAVVVERKDSFGETLGDFIQESFLTPDTIVERLRASATVARAAEWLADPDHASQAAGHLAGAAVALTDLVDDDGIERAVADMLRQRAQSVAVAPLAGRALRAVLADDRYREWLDAGLRGVDGLMDRHRDDLRRQLTEQSPWWLPGPVERRVFDHLYDGARHALREMAADPGHPLRRLLEGRLEQLATELETSPSFRDRGERLKDALLSKPQLLEWARSLWSDLEGQLRTAATDPGSELHQRLAAAVAALGARLRDDRALAAKVDEALETGVGYVAAHFRGEIAALVSHTIARWDADETARRLELLLGADLQYIRINGTVVGAGAGLVLYSLAQLLQR